MRAWVENGWPMLHFPSKTDYRRYVKKRQDRARINTNRVKGNSCVLSRPKFRPKIDTEKVYCNRKFRHVAVCYQNLVTMDEYCDRSQEEWRWLHYQGVNVSRSFSKICESFQRARISNNRQDLATISEPFGHNPIYADVDPRQGNTNVQMFESNVLQFSENGQINSFLDLIVKRLENLEDTDRSQEENFSKICESFQRARISNNRQDLATVSEPFGHNPIYADVDPRQGNTNVQMFESNVLQFSENGQINSFLDLVVKRL
ncbi:hypothetical protein TcasGA2_TC031286 [Tribolium castaneum]|uniref:Uncharacterized protein n=1 Tax=Tribolium castaneum TaxID=7070 RepID=A0A139WCT1_TRICA|nr:hypothetical protein TcasGA2_TC031286 [Tribolium castaneum]